MATWLITGSNRGIGLELCRQLHQRGEQLIAVCRSASAELEALGVRIESGIELSSEASIAELAARLAGVSLAGAILNAGVLEADGLEDLQADAIRRQFEVNALAPLLLARALLPNLGSGSKLALITSRMGSIDDNGSGGYYGYRMSKAAVNAAGMSLARDLASHGIAVGLFHPGMVATEMTGRNGIPPQDAARDLITRIDALALETSGKFVHAGTGEELPW